MTWSWPSQYYNYFKIITIMSCYFNILEETIKDITSISPLFFYHNFWNFCHNHMELVFQDGTIQKLIKAENLDFDLIIIESMFAQEPFVAFGHKLKVPVVTIHPFSHTPWQSFLTGNEFSFSLKVNYRSKFTEDMSFVQRLYNSLLNIIEFTTGYFYYLPKQFVYQEKLMKKYMVYPGSETRPSLLTMIRNISLFMIDYHYSIGYIDSLHPNKIPVGGLSLKNIPLPKVSFKINRLYIF